MVRAQVHDLRDGDTYTEWFDDKNEMFDCIVDWYTDCDRTFKQTDNGEYIVQIDDLEK
jgi:hypothetical protein